MNRAKAYCHALCQRLDLDHMLSFVTTLSLSWWERKWAHLNTIHNEVSFFFFSLQYTTVTEDNAGLKWNVSVTHSWGQMCVNEMWSKQTEFQEIINITCGDVTRHSGISKCCSFFNINLGDLCESFMGKESPLLPTWGVEEFKVTECECFII